MPNVHVMNSVAHLSYLLFPLLSHLVQFSQACYLTFLCFQQYLLFCYFCPPYGYDICDGIILLFHFSPELCQITLHS